MSSRSLIAQLPLVGVFQKGLAADELHGEVRLRAEAGVGRAGFVDLRDARVLQPAERLRFLFEAAQQLRAGKSGLDDLQRDGAARLIPARLRRRRPCRLRRSCGRSGSGRSSCRLRALHPAAANRQLSVHARERRQRGHEGLVWIFHSYGRTDLASARRGGIGPSSAGGVASRNSRSFLDERTGGVVK